MTAADYPPELHALQLRKIVAVLPRTAQDLLCELCWFLEIVAQNSEYSKMGLSNLGKVVGPSILPLCFAFSSSSLLHLRSLGDGSV
jgi:hypothetical protein